VKHLLRIYQYSQKYEADWELAWLQAEQRAAELRKNEPQPQEDDAAGAMRCRHAAAETVAAEQQHRKIPGFQGSQATTSVIPQLLCHSY
jgi:hypothetical protein